MLPCYEIRLLRRDDRSPDELFGGLQVRTDGHLVLIRGRLDQSALHGVLERIRVLRWDLQDLRRVRSRPGAGTAGRGGARA